MAVEHRGRLASPSASTSAHADSGDDNTKLQRSTPEAPDAGAALPNLQPLWNAIPVGIVLAHDARGEIVTVNDYAAKVLCVGARRQNIDLRKLGSRLHSGNVPLRFEDLPLQRALREGRIIQDFAARIERQDGSRTDLSISAFPVRDALGRVAGGVSTLVDEAAGSEGRRREQLLVSELQHRMRNLLASTRSLMRQTLSTSASLEEFADKFEGRLDALATAESVLSRNGAGKVDLHELILDVLPADTREDEDVVLAGPRVLLFGHAARILALAFYELASNAVEHGSWIAGGEPVRIDWSIVAGQSEDVLCLHWQETGTGLAAPPEKHGFGLDLVTRGLPYELGGQTSLTSHEGKWNCIIEIPAAKHVAALPPDYAATTLESRNNV